MKKIMLTGMTGYVGGILVRRLLNLGYEVQALVRNPAKVTLQHPNLSIIQGDIRDLNKVREALRGCSIAYYLVHGLDESESFEYQETLATQVFTDAVNREGTERVIYLGGLGHSEHLSPHLRSRQMAGKILTLGRAKVTEFRASVVLGQGSTSYEIICALINRLPFFVEPENLKALCQPIFSDDLIHYLLETLQQNPTESVIYEIGGSDQLSYAGLLYKVARHSGIKRKLIHLPQIEERIMFEAFELICPEYARVGGHLFESLSHSTVVMNDRAHLDFPDIRPLSLEQALDQVGRVKIEQNSVLSVKHTLKILKMLEGRFEILQKILPF
jgi:nucleoside-diphosphate-sugar epimerase